MRRVVDVALFVVVAALVVGTTLVRDEALRAVTARGPVVGLLAVALLVFATHVVAPLVANPVIVLGARAYGAVAVGVAVYAACLASAAVAFGLARRWGRPFLRRIVSRRLLGRADRALRRGGERLVVLARLFGFPLFDVVSYAAGLGPLRFSRYLVWTALLTPFPLAVEVLALDVLDLSSVGGALGFHLATSAVGVLLAGLWLPRRPRGRRERRPRSAATARRG